MQHAENVSELELNLEQAEHSLHKQRLEHEQSLVGLRTESDHRLGGLQAQLEEATHKLAQLQLEHHQMIADLSSSLDDSQEEVYRGKSRIAVLETELRSTREALSMAEVGEKV